MNIAVYFIRSCATGQLPGCSCDKLIGKRRRQVQLSLSGHITCVLCFCVCLLCVCVFSWISLAMLHLFYARCLQLIKFTVILAIVDMNILRGRLICCPTRFFNRVIGEDRQTFTGTAAAMMFYLGQSSGKLKL